MEGKKIDKNRKTAKVVVAKFKKNPSLKKIKNRKTAEVVVAKFQNPSFKTKQKYIIYI